MPLLSSVDTGLMGHFSAAHLGAVGIGSMIFNFIYWNFGFLRMGTVGLTAQSYGSGDSSGIVHTFFRAIALSVLIALVLLVFQKPIGDFMLYLMQIKGDQLALSARYFHIRIWGAPATLALYVFFGFFFGMQNVIFPLIMTIAVNIINILMSVLLIKQFGMDIEGVAYGTVIAQYAGVVIGIWFFFRKYQYLLVSFRKKVLLEWAPIRAFFKLNRDIFIRTLSLSSVFFFFYSQSSAQGELVLASNVIMLQFLNWMSFGVDGFAYASESLVGKYKGAKDFLTLKKVVRYSFLWGMGLALVYSLVYGLLGVSILELFTDQESVINYTRPFLWWMVLLPILGTPSYIWDGVYIGLTASGAMRNTMVLAFGLFLVTYYLTKSPLREDSLWLSLMVFLVVRGLSQWWLYAWKGIELR